MQLLDIAPIRMEDLWGEDLNPATIHNDPETIDVSAEFDVVDSLTMNDVAETAMDTPPELLWTIVIVLVALLLCIYFAIRYRRNHEKTR